MTLDCADPGDIVVLASGECVRISWVHRFPETMFVRFLKADTSFTDPRPLASDTPIVAIVSKLADRVVASATAGGEVDPLARLLEDAPLWSKAAS